MMPNEFLELAKILAKGQKEAEWRTAVSRAYYAAFHFGREYLTRLGFRIPKSERAHRFITLRIMNCQFPAVERAGSDLDDFKRDRNVADYDISVKFDLQMSIDAINLANSIISVLHNSTKDQTILTMITDVVRSYERDVLKEPTWQPPKK